jgi:hypothetical protein
MAIVHNRKRDHLRLGSAMKACVGFLTAALAASAVAQADEVRFGRDILPILSDRCFHCHGPDPAHREADLRLDEEAAANRVLAPLDPPASELLRRISSDDPETRMPPPASRREQLAEEEIETFRRWIAGGAKWGRHWAFEKPERPVVPIEGVHPIDAFLQRQREKAGLAASPPAEKATLARRLSFDLTGLPPSPEEVDAFVADPSSEAYANLVDRLLQSPHYGERMSMWWLDAARYADTDGYQGDAVRNNWPWRDWVIQSFNANMPFDQFTIEQFAGDLLPEATPEQVLATCFHRNHMTNGEGGRDPEESRIDYVLDRVNTMGTVWLGLTLGCCQCHSHKFDPISQADYYGLFAFFNSIDEDGRASTGAKPYLKYKSPLVERAVQEAQALVEERIPLEAAAKAKAEREFEPWLAEQIGRVKSGFEAWRPLIASSVESVEGTILVQEAGGDIQTSGPIPRQDDYRVIAHRPNDLARMTGLRLDVLPHATNTDGKLSRGKTGEFILTDVKLFVRQPGRSQVREIEMANAVADAEIDAQARQYGKVKDTLDDDPRNGWTTEGHDATQAHAAVFALAQPLKLSADEEMIFVLMQRSTVGDANIGRFRVSATDQPGEAVRSMKPMPLEELAAANVDNEAGVPEELRGKLLAQFLADHPDYQHVKAMLETAKAQLAEAQGMAKVDVMVLGELAEPRATHVLERGVWNKHGEAVQRAVPSAILPWTPDETKTRLDLAKWIVSRENPLTARVTVNQLWQIFFGTGLVRTMDNFGLQGELPTHPELLDWLAVELMEHNWNLQHVIRLIVTSQAYRQSSDVTPELLEADPENRLFARAMRYRLPSWMIRDAQLRASGLLNPALGGPPVKPYQPDGVWEALFMGGRHYEPSQRPAQYRRTVYAFWRRSSAPTFLFDNAARRVCQVQNRITNTPLHALTLLNDLNGLDAARELARLTMKAKTDETERLSLLFRRALSRAPREDELAVLRREWTKSLAYYREHPGDARDMLIVGQPLDESEINPDRLDEPEFAAYMVAASLVFNLDEAVTRE